MGERWRVAIKDKNGIMALGEDEVRRFGRITLRIYII